MAPFSAAIAGTEQPAAAVSAMQASKLSCPVTAEATPAASVIANIARAAATIVVRTPRLPRTRTIG